MPRLPAVKKSPRVVVAGPPVPEAACENGLALVKPLVRSEPLAEKTSFIVRATHTAREEPVVAALGLEEDGEITVDDVIRCAKHHAERELRKVHEGRRVTEILRAGHEDGSIDASLVRQLETLDADGDGVISNEEVANFCKHFAEQQLALAEEHEAREAAEHETRQLRTRLVGRPRGFRK